MQINIDAPLLVLSGENMQGKNSVVEKLAKDNGYFVVYVGSKVDDIREMIQNCYLTDNSLIYYIQNGDNLTPQAQNALLKICEEPPTNVITIISINYTVLIPTLKSRAHIYDIPLPTVDEIHLYTKEKIKASQEGFLGNIVDICDTFEDVDLLLSIDDINEFIQFCDKVINNIETVSLVNAFKITQSLALKETQTDKYDVRLFFKTINDRINTIIFFNHNFNNLEMDEISKLSDLAGATSYALSILTVPGVNKKHLVDYWIMSVRTKLLERKLRI